MGARALRAESHLIRLLGSAAGEGERLLRVSAGSHFVLLDLADGQLSTASRSRSTVGELSSGLQISEDSF